MSPIINTRRGSCLIQTLMGLAVVGFLLLVGGVIFMLTSDAMSAVADVQKQISNFTE